MKNQIRPDVRVPHLVFPNQFCMRVSRDIFYSDFKDTISIENRSTTLFIVK